MKALLLSLILLCCAVCQAGPITVSATVDNMTSSYITNSDVRTIVVPYGKHLEVTYSGHAFHTTLSLNELSVWFGNVDPPAGQEYVNKYIYRDSSPGKANVLFSIPPTTVVVAVPPGTYQFYAEAVGGYFGGQQPYQATMTATATLVPEPSAWALALMGLLVLGGCAYEQSKLSVTVKERTPYTEPEVELTAECEWH
jgi:(2Fe-2S) ferredoxin